MKKKITFFTVALFLMNAAFAQSHYIKITLDTKQMINPDYSLGGGNGVPSTCTKVYAHLGLCTCDLDWNTGTSTYDRDCVTPDSNQFFCYHQILPYRSNVWEHVVGNWGDNPQDDGIGLMTALGNGVYSIEFIIENYFSDPTKVNTTQFIDPNDPHPVVQSTVWNPSNGGLPYTIGMVFRNEDATLTGRDDLGKDLFIINLTSQNPQVVQGSDVSAPFPAITFTTGIGEIDNSVHYLSLNPNPLINQSQIVYSLVSETNNLQIKVYNVFGQTVKNLHSGPQNSGSYSINWDGTNENGKSLANGIYYLTMTANGENFASVKIILSK
jgi:hypothetical protein